MTHLRGVSSAGLRNGVEKEDAGESMAGKGDLLLQAHGTLARVPRGTS